MSFHFEKIFKNVDAAKKALQAPDNSGSVDEHNAKVIPQTIRTFMLAALYGLDPSKADRAVRVKAIGHLCDSEATGSYNITNADVLVAPMELHD